MIKVGHNYVAVKLEGEEFYTKNLKSKTSEFSLGFDPSFDPTRWIKTEAEIHSVGWSFDENLKEFAEDLKDCHAVVFDYKALEQSDYVLDTDGRRVYFVPVGFIFCGIASDVELDSQMIYALHPDWTICKPFYGFGFIEEDGAIVKKSPSGIITEINPDPDERIAVMKESEGDFEVGSLVFREANTNYEYEVMGETVYMVRKENIDGVLTGSNFSHNNIDFVDDYKDVVKRVDIGKQIENINDL